MSYLKSLTSKDVIVTPFTVHKQFSYSSTPPGYNPNGVSVFDGRNISYPLSGGEEGTGSLSLVYNSIEQLYYSNYILSNNGLVSDASTASFNPDGTVTGPKYTPNYINNVQSINELKYFPMDDNDYISVLSIPQKQFGEYIKPGSFSSIGLSDDGEGNLIFNGTGDKCGNIIYEAGLVIYTGLEGGGGTTTFANPQWESTVTIYETQYKCTIRANEYNYSLNPSLLTTYGSGSIITSGSATYKNFVTGEDFLPYITTIGLYNDNQDLIAVAKLAQPLPTSQTTDTTILINLDR